MSIPKTSRLERAAASARARREEDSTTPMSEPEAIATLRQTIQEFRALHGKLRTAIADAEKAALASGREDAAGEIRAAAGRFRTAALELDVLDESLTDDDTAALLDAYELFGERHEGRRLN